MQLELKPFSSIPKKKSVNVFSVIGARNFAVSEREKNDYYATSPLAIDKLMEIETFQHCILEPCCGEGHMAEALKSYGHDVEAFDLIDRGYGKVNDFFTLEETTRDIITNPPFSNIILFIEKGISLLKRKNQKLALFMRLLTLEGKARKMLFESTPPIRIWVSSGRINCAKGGDFQKYKSNTAQAYAWFIWEYGFKGETILKWF